jgi:L-ribulose-5-phosphate 4-epimerase
MTKTMLQRLREEVLEPNLELTRRGLVLYTFGNASGICRGKRLIVIKPSGVPYGNLRPEHLVVRDLGGKVVEGELRPSSDLPTHLFLYKAFPEIGGVAHTHSEYETAWAQARQPIPCLGTTHADTFHGPVPVAAAMTEQDIVCNYEENTGRAIVQAMEHSDYQAVPTILVANHGPFTWGSDPGMAARFSRPWHERRI